MSEPSKNPSESSFKQIKKSLAALFLSILEKVELPFEMFSDTLLE